MFGSGRPAGEDTAHDNVCGWSHEGVGLLVRTHCFFVLREEVLAETR
jgi:hypothetical protein